MKLMTVFFLLTAMINSFASTKPDFAFSCQTIFWKEKLKTEVELYFPNGRHPMSGLSGVFGTMNIGRDEKNLRQVKVTLIPDFWKFSLYGKEMIEGKEYQFELHSDHRAIEGGKKIGAKILIKEVDSPWEKAAEFTLVCDGEKMF